MQDQFSSGPARSACGGGEYPHLLGPRTSCVLCACALVATGYWLGARWLGSLLLGVPVGLWLIGAGLATLLLWQRRDGGQGPLALLGSPRRAFDLRLRLPRLSVQGAVATIFELAGLPARRFGRVAEKAGDWLTQHGAPSPRLRIGLDLPGPLAATLARLAASETCSGLPVEWLRVSPGHEDERDAVSAGVDAIVRLGASGPDAGEPVILVPEHDDRPAAWHDWSRRPPLNYATVFPPRVDTARITLRGCDPERERDARLLARLAETAALLGRSPARVSLRSRFFGAGPIIDSDRRGGPVERCVLGLVAALRHDWSDGGGARSSACRAAARAAGAWLTCWEGDLSADERLRAIETADAFIAEEPESALRLAAASFAAYADEAGLEAVLRAQRMLRGSEQRGGECTIDPLAFVMSEIEHGVGGPLTLGRVAAGICLLWSTANADSLPYLRDDLMDELRYAGWLIGRDQDHCLLKRVIFEMDRAFGHRPIPRYSAAA